MSFHTPFSSQHLCALGRSSGLGLSASQLDGVVLLRGLVALLDGGRALDGSGAQVGAVSLLASGVNDLAVDAAGASVGAEGGRLGARGWLVRLVGLLGQEGDAAVGGWHQANGLVVDVAFLLLAKCQSDCAV